MDVAALREPTIPTDPAERAKLVDRLRGLLLEDKGSWAKIARETGLEYRTIVRFANKQFGMPYGRFIPTLAAHYERQAAEAGKDARAV